MRWPLLGRLDEALACQREALRLAPDFAKAHSDLLFCLNYLARPVAECMAEARRFGAAAGARVAAHSASYSSWPAAAVTAAPLRVGLVSGDLREHPVGYFLESMIERVDPARVELFAYPSAPWSDALTARI
jgi:predicted O-linked N-acetylglucosamine transferase (SPINDLY family)